MEMELDLFILFIEMKIYIAKGYFLLCYSYSYNALGNSQKLSYFRFLISKMEVQKHYLLG